eukprot:m.46186 g.46186  ORF g.46186 m.46186 type:complete len:103 (+) comp20166_c0_seq2:2251-2559(+)
MGVWRQWSAVSVKRMYYNDGTIDLTTPTATTTARGWGSYLCVCGYDLKCCPHSPPAHKFYIENHIIVPSYSTALEAKSQPTPPPPPPPRTHISAKQTNTYVK